MSRVVVPLTASRPLGVVQYAAMCPLPSVGRPSPVGGTDLFSDYVVLSEPALHLSEPALPPIMVIYPRV